MLRCDADGLGESLWCGGVGVVGQFRLRLPGLSLSPDGEAIGNWRGVKYEHGSWGSSVRRALSGNQPSMELIGVRGQLALLRDDGTPRQLVVVAFHSVHQLRRESTVGRRLRHPDTVYVADPDSWWAVGIGWPAVDGDAVGSFMTSALFSRSWGTALTWTLKMSTCGVTMFNDLGYNSGRLTTSTKEQIVRVPEPVETYGYFWLSNQAGRQLSGILRISETGESSLEIFGSFCSLDLRSGRNDLGAELHILGVTHQEGPVTLVNCLVIGQQRVTNVGGQLSRSNLYVGSVFCGVHFETHDISFSCVTFSVEGLDEWFSLYHHPFSSSGGLIGPLSLSYIPPEPITFGLPDDLIVTFHMDVDEDLGMFHQSMTTKVNISLSSKRPRSFSEFMQVLRRVKNFLCLAFDRPVSFTSVTGHNEEPDAPYGGQQAVDIYGKLDAYDVPKADIHPGYFLIPFDEIADTIQECLPRWLEHYEEYEPTFNLYFAVLANRHMHLEGRFLFLVHGIESLHRRSSVDRRMADEEFSNLLHTILESTPSKWKQLVQSRLKYANEPSLRSRLRKMISRFRDLFGNEFARSTFANQIVSTRNYLTHYDDGIRNEAVTEPQELLQLHSKMEALVQLHLLELLGIERDHIQRIATRYPPLRQKLGME